MYEGGEREKERVPLSCPLTSPLTSLTVLNKSTHDKPANGRVLQARMCATLGPQRMRDLCLWTVNEGGPPTKQTCLPRRPELLPHHPHHTVPPKRREGRGPAATYPAGCDWLVAMVEPGSMQAAPAIPGRGRVRFQGPGSFPVIDTSRAQPPLVHGTPCCTVVRPDFSGYIITGSGE